MKKERIGGRRIAEKLPSILSERGIGNSAGNRGRKAVFPRYQKSRRGRYGRIKNNWIEKNDTIY